MKCNTVGDFKRMIEKMNIPDDATIECVVTQDGGYSSYGAFRDVTFEVTEYDNGSMYISGDNVDVSSDRTAIYFGSV